MPPTIKLGQPADNALLFYTRRSQAIDSYSNLEQALCSTLTHLLGSDQEVGSVVYFQLTNTRSRTRIIQDLLKKRYEDQYDSYWNGIKNSPNKRGLFSLISELDSRRNEIIHWHTVNEITVENDVAVNNYVLRPPAFFSNKSTGTIVVKDLEEFCRRSDFAIRSLNMFGIFNNLTIDPGGNWREALRDIFQRPCTYPPPDSHPLSPNYVEPQNPPQP